MEKIVEYKLHAGHVPYFIKNGGYFYNNFRLVGLTYADEECYIPNTLKTFNAKQELIDYVASIYPDKTTSSEEIVNNFLKQIGGTLG
jgi:hypothetical protein